MKILIVRMWPDTLNIKNYNCQEVGLAKALIRKGHQCDIVLYTKEEKKDEELIFDNANKKIHIYYLKAKSFFKNAIYEKRLYKIIKNYDVIQTAEYDQIRNVKLRKKSKNKMVIYHGPYSSSYTKGYKKKCLISDIYYTMHKKYKTTPCLSKSNLATQLLEKKGFIDITTVGVGLDIERFEKMKEPNEIIKKLKNQKNEDNLKYMLYIGRIEERRNIPFLIDILAKVLEKNSGIRLIMVGNGSKEYISKCVEYAKEKKVYDKILYYQEIKQEELSHLYKCSDVFLLPTQYEIFGMVLLETMYFGIPTVTTLNGGSSTLIENGKTGMICSLNDLEGWSNAVEKIINDEQLKTIISENSQRKIKENFVWDSLVEKFIDVYKKVTN